MTTTRLRRRERNRAAILEGARQLIIERGPENLSLREVAARAEYSPAGLYRYFKDKALITVSGKRKRRRVGAPS
jgi:AcrR family transcriptional regulator